MNTEVIKIGNCLPVKFCLLFAQILVTIITIMETIPISKIELKPASGIGFGIKRPFKLRKTLSLKFILFFALGNILNTAWYQKNIWSNKGTLRIISI